MKYNVRLALVVALVVACAIISIAVAAATVQGTDKSATAPAEIKPAASSSIISVQWWKNGINKGNIPFDTAGEATISVGYDDTIMFKVKGIYQGSGTGYMLFRYPDIDYQESWLLKPGVVTTKNLARSYQFSTNTFVRFETHLPGSNYNGPGDWHKLTINIV